ncbi:hypothetical protein [Streptomyces virginiae]|uniref:hypothetical protein n=1 Tax=Streptomyces virginiae TaxID=1961 RepID=UPI002256B0D8|nr:hypothetical protein [Streptomyces virginiae]MCX5174601.1 hypothetical protein [Streptomyces virginiae]
MRAVGRTVPLCPDAARQVAAHLTAAAPGHPWEGVRFAATWGSRDVLDTTLVHPALVAEVSADRAIDHGGIHRHLVLQAPAPVIARALGYHDKTTVHLVTEAGGTWNRYAPGDHTR